MFARTEGASPLPFEPIVTVHPLLVMCGAGRAALETENMACSMPAPAPALGALPLRFEIIITLLIIVLGERRPLRIANAIFAAALYTINIAFRRTTTTRRTLSPASPSRHPRANLATTLCAKDVVSWRLPTPRTLSITPHAKLVERLVRYSGRQGRELINDSLSLHIQSPTAKIRAGVCPSALPSPPNCATLRNNSMSHSERNAFCFVACALLFVAPSPASTVITNTRAEVSFMASLWEADAVQISTLANAQYPQFTSDWEYIFPHSSLSDDLDIHIDLAVDSSGSGSTNNNIGVSPVIAEVVNATSAQLNTLRTYAGSRSRTRGVFRFWTEHANERHFELHPVTELAIWNGTDFAPDIDYRSNINYVADGTTHPNSVLAALLNGSQTVTASVLSDNEHIAFTYPSPSVNYVQYAGLAVSSVLSDSVSSYFLLRPSLVPTAIVKCRIPAGTSAAATATTLASNQTINVNALTRTD